VLLCAERGLASESAGNPRNLYIALRWQGTNSFAANYVALAICQNSILKPILATKSEVGTSGPFAIPSNTAKRFSSAVDLFSALLRTFCVMMRVLRRSPTEPLGRFVVCELTQLAGARRVAAQLPCTCSNSRRSLPLSRVGTFHRRVVCLPCSLGAELGFLQ